MIPYVQVKMPESSDFSLVFHRARPATCTVFPFPYVFVKYIDFVNAKVNAAAFNRPPAAQKQPVDFTGKFLIFLYFIRIP